MLVLLYLSTAFDAIDQNMMLSRLQNLFRMNGDALLWLKSYFSDRTQRIVLKDSSSKLVYLCQLECHRVLLLD